jgi:mono/diheme cytochrome c family protein
MKLLHRQSLCLLIISLVLGVVVAGCAPNAEAQLISPQLGAQLYAEESNAVVEAEPTPAPVTFAELTPEQVTAGLPADFAAALASADPSKGPNLVLVNGCSGCHSEDDPTGGGRAGPSWVNLADHASNRVPGESPALYIHDSIVNPGAYVVPNFPNGVMPQDFGQRLSTEDLADLVAYLLTLHQ